MLSREKSCDDVQQSQRAFITYSSPVLIGPWWCYISPRSARGMFSSVARTYGGKKKTTSSSSVAIAPDDIFGSMSARAPSAPTSEPQTTAKPGAARRLSSSRTPLRSLSNVDSLANTRTGMKKPSSMMAAASDSSDCPATAMSVVPPSKGGTAHTMRKGKRAPPGTPESTPSSAKTRIFSPSVSSSRPVERVARRLSTSYSSLSSATPRISSSSTSSSISSGTTNTSSRSSTAKAPLPRIFNRADAEDLAYLHEAVVCNQGSSRTFIGFGKGLVIFPPDEWDQLRRLRLRELCQAVGFEAKTQGGRVYLQLETRKVAKLKRDLTSWKNSTTLTASQLADPPSMIMEEGVLGVDSSSVFEFPGGSITGQEQKKHHDSLPEPRLSDVMMSLGSLVIKEGNEEEEEEEAVAGGEKSQAVVEDELGHRSPVAKATDKGGGLEAFPGSPCFSEESGGDHSGFIIRKRQSGRRSGSSRSSPSLRGSRSPQRCLSRTPPHSPLSDGHRGDISQDNIDREHRHHQHHHHHQHRDSSGRDSNGRDSNGRDSSGSRTFETPSSIKQGDRWVRSCRANTASITRLTLRFQKEEEAFGGEDGRRSSGLLPSPHLRYSLPSPPHASTCLQDDRRAMERSRRSKALLRRVSMGIVARPRFSISRALGALTIVDEPDVSMSESQHEDVDKTVAAGTTAAITTVNKLGFLTVSCLEYLPLKDVPFPICRAWASGSYPLHAQARILADLDHGHQRHPEIFTTWKSLWAMLPCGQFLSDGAYKSVYRVWCTASERVEAVSVMDVQAITETGNMAVVTQELHASILAAGLVRTGVCPNVVETYGILRSGYDPNFGGMWSCDDESFLLRRTRGNKKGPEASKEESKDYQLIRMELCRHGDLEGFLRRQPDGLVPADVALQLTFQMCYSLYAVRQALTMRHYDVKLLNFLVTDFKAPQHQQGPASAVRYGFGSHVYHLRMRPPWNLCVKLADFGTADVCETTLGGHIGMERFTTLENTPPEFLIDGDRVRLHYAVDTFPLGLAVLHLFTGSMPYEEWMEDVVCPVELREALTKVWKSGGADYSTLASLLEACEEEDEEEATLYHTFYRYLVLLGLPNESDRVADNPVWNATLSLIAPRDDPPAADGKIVAAAGTRGRSKKPKVTKKAAKVTAQYWKDYSSYSLACGTQPLIARARARLDALPGAMDLLRSFLDFRPERRWTMHAALNSRAFEGLREDEGAAAGHHHHHHHHRHDDATPSFLAYRCSDRWPRGIPDSV